MSRVLVTGANGFVGRALCRALRDAGNTVTGLVRRQMPREYGVDEWVDPSVDFAGMDAGWPEALQVDCVVHLAARVHVMLEDAADPEAAFQATNVEGTLRCARAAWRHGVRRFVFVSSIKAMTEADSGRPVREDDSPAPQDPYGRSKRAAEEALIRLGAQTGLEIVIVRPPLVYGPDVRANFLSLMNAVWKGVPLPLGALGARRSLVYVDNLADALVHCATDARAAQQCFHVADSDALTIAELARALGRHLGRPARLLPVPESWLRLAGRLTGRTAQVDRLVGSLQLDTSRIRTVLGWQAPYSTEEGLAATAHWYRSTH
ncbi:UDP-glucose 4-epimerase family protein [Paraburkholderia phytofirmans]|uniref:NAD-dependent epimerase/dehydratase n=2 Tax=Paraburkholderia phytofirmans TaxID=261302 RepID=B2T0L5_PARPJ|nr:SDR family oxidoreductase [Paraburkholderia phytofirmans]ACD15320.1 NAD-dependent epimerase/dehydratase [Paraburkholderia phytofirmans PsJN]